MVKTFSPFGYDGSLVSVEVDLRRGIPAVDIVGLADGSVKESRERVKAAIKNCGFDFPAERVLISLSPADLKKEGAGIDLALALAIIKADKLDVVERPDLFVMGELQPNGEVKSVNGIYAGLERAKEEGVQYAIIPYNSEKAPEGIRVARVKDLKEAIKAMIYFDDEEYYSEEKENEFRDLVEFEKLEKSHLDEIEGHNRLKFAAAVAVAGRHSILAYGAPGNGKTIVLQCMTELMPKLTKDEEASVRRIYSIAGLTSPNELMTRRPFRMPHQTCSIEGMCGGGTQCRPGEISLAHNGVLFLDEAAEFRTSVLQMLRVPLECGTITLSRAGRSTCFPAKFQLAMTANPCPCGNYGNPDKVCLCSMKSVEQYWKKFSAPLLDRVAIKLRADTDDWGTVYTCDELRELIKTAWETQLLRQGKLNNDLTAEEIVKYIKLPAESETWLDKVAMENDWSPRTIANVKRVARTLADMAFRDDITDMDVSMAAEYNGKLTSDF